jgi:hypothetical protein
MEVRIITPGLLALRRDLQAVNAAGLGRDMGRRLNAVVMPLTADIRREAGTLPAAGGYAGVMARSVRAKAKTRTNKLSALISVTIYAAGQKENRDIVRVDAGVIRHPVFGRSRKTRRGRQANPWAVTSTRAGFVSRPIDRLEPEVSRAALGVVNDLMAKLRG